MPYHIIIYNKAIIIVRIQLIITIIIMIIMLTSIH